MEICSICGIALSDAYLASGTIVGGFLIENELGRGGMGIVYKAKQLNLERHVALKILSDTLSRDIDFVDRFFQEARAAASLSHPNIVQAFDAGSTAEGIYYLAMELIEGETLDTRITRDGAIQQDTALDICGKIAGAMNYAWQKQNLCHGDIKPDNIILNSSGDAKLADLGLAKTAHDTRESEIMGTPLYAAPELIKGEIDHINMKSDIYSFGATLYHMLSGAPPFPGQDPDEVMNRHLVETPLPLIERNREINAGTSVFVEQMLAKNPHDRPSSWAEVVETIEFLHQHKEHKTVHKEPGDAFFNWEKKAVQEKKPLNTLLLSLSITLAVIIIVAIFYFLGPRHSQSQGDPSGKPSDIAAKWEKIKTQTQFMTIEKALVELEAFIKNNSGQLPPDAAAFLAEMKTKKVTESNIKNQKAAFQKEIDFLTKYPDAELAKMPLKNLGDFKNRVLSAMNKPKQDALTAPLLDETHTALLSSKIKAVNTFISRKKEEETRVANQEKLRKTKEQKAKEESDKIAREKKEKEEKEKIAREQRRKAEIAGNAQIDEYFKTCAEFLSLKKRSASQLLSDISDFQKNHKNLPQPYAGRIAFLKKRLADALSIVEVFVKNDFLLKGKPVPLKSADGEYKVEAVDNVSITLFLVDEKVRLGRKIKWLSLKNEEYIELIANTVMRQENTNRLDEPAQRAIIIYLLLSKRFPELEIAANRFTKFTPADKQEWLMTAGDFSAASMEVEASELWKTINTHVKNREMEEAAAKMGELSSKYGKTTFCRRYESEIAGIRKILKL